jgi:hypothetical protein
MPPHPRVHRRRDENWANVCEHRLAQDIVRKSVRHPRERVRRQRCDDEEIPATEMGIGVGARPLSGERVERLGRNEALGSGRDHRFHLMPRSNEQADERARLVGRYPAGHSEQDARHAASVSWSG